ncbi:hypothetical protein DFH09DRAFT_1286114 [Mycena vulgaris]|nr:hypothetical protein DFH09DRAFT_1286114 [Mycena vulgaris]
MFFASPFVSAALMMLASVTALPQPEDGGLVERSAPACLSGQYLVNSADLTSCTNCPAGSSCDGNTAKQCNTGYYQYYATQTYCNPTQPGFYTNAKGSSIPIPCPAGSYQPYPAQAFCYGAPKGRFQGLPGQATVCGTCCGWAAPLANNNIAPVNCTGTTPYASPSSGDGCVSVKPSCVRAASCRQTYNTTTYQFDCPAETIRG